LKKQPTSFTTICCFDPVVCPKDCHFATTKYEINSYISLCLMTEWQLWYICSSQWCTKSINTNKAHFLIIYKLSIHILCMNLFFNFRYNKSEINFQGNVNISTCRCNCYIQYYILICFILILMINIIIDRQETNK